MFYEEYFAPSTIGLASKYSGFEIDLGQLAGANPQLHNVNLMAGRGGLSAR